VSLRIGVAHHYGWAVAVTATDAAGGHRVVDRRRIELLEPGRPAAPIHHEGGPHDVHRAGPPLTDDELASLVAEVRASARRATEASLAALAADVGQPIASLSVRSWSPDLPTDIAVLRRPPHEARADSVMYCQVLAEVAEERGWAVHLYDARVVEREATRVLGDRADDVLVGPRARLGPPWAKDHRTALAATVLAG
jgi:hypothetical protein